MTWIIVGILCIAGGSLLLGLLVGPMMAFQDRQAPEEKSWQERTKRADQKLPAVYVIDRLYPVEHHPRAREHTKYHVSPTRSVHRHARDHVEAS